MTTQTLVVPFNGQTLTAAIIDKTAHVALKPICENLGLQWHGQTERIKRHPVLNQVIRKTRTTCLGKDGKSYNIQMLMLPIDYLNGWLFGVDVNRVKPDIKEKLIKYQRECFNVLAEHFMLPRPVNETELYKQARAEADNYKANFERLANQQNHTLAIQLTPLAGGGHKRWIVTQQDDETLVIKALEEGGFATTSGKLAKLIADDAVTVSTQDLPTIIEAAAKRLNAAQRQTAKR